MACFHRKNSGAVSDVSLELIGEAKAAFKKLTEDKVRLTHIIEHADRADDLMRFSLSHCAEMCSAAYRCLAPLLLRHTACSGRQHPTMLEDTPSWSAPPTEV